MATIRLTGAATLHAAAQALDLADDEMDQDYGVVPIDPKRDLYVVRISADAARRLNAAGVPGVYSDPPIEPQPPHP